MTSCSENSIAAPWKNSTWRHPSYSQQSGSSWKPCTIFVCTPFVLLLLRRRERTYHGDAHHKINAYGALYLLVASALIDWPAPPWLMRLPSLAQEARAILEKHCAACHGPGGKATKGGSIISSIATDSSRPQGSARQAGDSPLLQRIEQGEMPPRANDLNLRPRISPLCALDRCRRSALPGDGPVQALRVPSSLRRAAAIQMEIASERRFTHYLTLTHFANEGISEKNCNITRERPASCSTASPGIRASPGPNRSTRTGPSCASICAPTNGPPRNGKS